MDSIRIFCQFKIIPEVEQFMKQEWKSTGKSEKFDERKMEKANGFRFRNHLGFTSKVEF